MRKRKLQHLLPALACLCWSLAAGAITPAELQDRIDADEDMTLIDVRNNAVYLKGHIYNAINIPARIIAGKRLPPIGTVIVYGDGIDEEPVAQAAEQLNGKAGISAEVLEGGYTAWLGNDGLVVQPSGMASADIRQVTYKQLQRMSLYGKGVVLVDLRMAADQEILDEHFPSLRVYDPISVQGDDLVPGDFGTEVVADIPKRNRSVLILIDDGNGYAEDVAQKLHAAGARRVAVLIGGELALETRGVAGEVIRED